MAYDVTSTANFGNRPAYRILLYVRRDNTSGNSSSYAWQLRAQQTSSGSTWTANSYPWSVTVGGQTFTGNAASLDFRSSNDIFVASGTTGFISHDGNGNLNIQISAWYHTDGHELFGNADIGAFWFATDHINILADAPYNLTLRNGSIKYNSAGIDYYRGSDHGTPIDQDQAQWATDAGFTSVAWDDYGPNGYTNPNGIIALASGTVYYIRIRSHNAAGWSGWSGTGVITTATVPGAPAPVAITELASTSFVYQFSGGSDGGSPITSWQTQWSLNSNFTAIQGTVTNVPSNGFVSFSGLTPGTKYWMRTRGVNAAGAGPWSASLATTTLSGAFVGRSGTFSAVAVYVGKAEGFVLAEVRVGKGGSFVIAS